MDPTIVSTAVVSLLVPYLDKAADGFAGEAGKAVWQAAKSSLDRLRTAFGDGSDDALELFERAPRENGEQLARRLDELMTEDSELLRSLNDLVEAADRAAPQLNIVQRVSEARNVVGLRASETPKGSSVNVTQDVGRAEDVSGVVLDQGGNR